MRSSSLFMDEGEEPAKDELRNTPPAASSLKSATQSRPAPPLARNRFADDLPFQQEDAKRRGANVRPANRFNRLRYSDDESQSSGFEGPADQLPILKTDVYEDDSHSIIAQNDSPDLGFRYSINPYRGCEHACTYCYARPFHEYLGFDAGLDFETKLMAKPNAAELLRDELARPGWRCEPIMMSGVTDCYQPIERRLKLTRQCLEVLAEAGQPVGIATKSDLIVRDLDLLSRLAADRLVHVAVSITTLDAKLQRSMEPRAASPKKRLATIEALAAAGVPTSVLVAPVIPGLTDHEIPAILRAASEAGARSSGYVLLRLPGSVRTVFFNWLSRAYPGRLGRVESRLRAMRNGDLYQSEFGRRMTGSGPLADQVKQIFGLFAKRFNVAGTLPSFDCTKFRPPTPTSGQLTLF
ncbi:MAG: PA0069 family radical SAM protein [Planctomycetia bacterium]